MQSRRHEVGQKDPNSKVLGIPPRHAGEAVSGGDRRYEGDIGEFIEPGIELRDEMAPLMSVRVFVSAKARERNGADIAGAKPAAATPMPAFVRRAPASSSEEISKRDKLRFTIPIRSAVHPRPQNLEKRQQITTFWGRDTTSYT